MISGSRRRFGLDSSVSAVSSLPSAISVSIL
jgi:hypothetical protein